jgi:HTH-like domain
LIAAEKTNFPVAVMCRVLGVNRTAFHNWERRAPSDRALQDAWLTDKITQIHDASRDVYGAPRIHAELRLEHGVRVGRKRVARLMKAAGISGVRPRKRGGTTIRISRDRARHRPGRAACIRGQSRVAGLAWRLHRVLPDRGDPTLPAPRSPSGALGGAVEIQTTGTQPQADTSVAAGPPNPEPSAVRALAVLAAPSGRTARAV